VSDAVLPPDTVGGCQYARGGERVVRRLLGLRKDAAVVPPSRLGCLDREQDAPLRIDVQIRARRGSQLASGRETRIVSGSRAENERECCQEQCRDGQQPEPGENRIPPPRTPP